MKRLIALFGILALAGYAVFVLMFLLLTGALRHAGIEVSLGWHFLVITLAFVAPVVVGLGKRVSRADAAVAMAAFGYLIYSYLSSSVTMSGFAFYMMVVGTIGGLVVSTLAFVAPEKQ